MSDEAFQFDPQPAIEAAKLPGADTRPSIGAPSQRQLIELGVASFANTLDHAGGVQAYRLDSAYDPVVDALAERTGLPKSHWRKPWYERLAVPYMDSSVLDRDAIWRDIANVQRSDPKAFADLGTRSDFEKHALTRPGRAQDLDTLSRGRGVGATLAEFAGGFLASPSDPFMAATIPIGGAFEGTAAKILGEGAINATVTAAGVPERKVAAERLGETYTGTDALVDVGTAGLFGSALRTGIEFGPRVSTVFARAVPEHLRTPDEAAALNVTNRADQVAAANPFEQTYEGLDRHAQKLTEAMAEIEDGRLPVDRPTPAEPIAAVRPTAPVASGPSTLDGTIVRLLERGGLTAEQARGVAAGIHAESTSDPLALNHESGAFGLGQWLGPRKDELFRRYGTNPTLEQQIEFLLHELKGGDAGGPKVLAHGDEAGVLRSYIEDFMRPHAGAETTGDLARGMAALGRGGEALPAGEGATGAGAIDQVDAALAAEQEDVDLARVRADVLEAEKPVVTTAGQIVPTATLRPDEIGVDAGLMQFKSGGDEFGVTDRLQGVPEWDPVAAGMLTVWEDTAGRRLIADGHQRLALAKRIEAQTGADIELNAFVLREADGFSARDARIIAARKNIGEGTGTILDAAKVFREAGRDAERLLSSLPPRSALVRDGKALSTLEREALGAVVNDVIPESQGAAIGHLAPDKSTHLALVGLLARTQPATRREAEAIIRQALDAGFTRETQNSLFGEAELVRGLYAERAKVLDRGLSELKRLKGAFTVAARNADTLEGAGNKIDVAASEAAAAGNARALGLVERLVERLALRKGNAVNELLDQAARRLADGERIGGVVRDFAGGVRKLDLADLERQGGAAGGVGDGVGGSGRSGEPALRDEQDLQTELTPAEQDAATELGLFGDPSPLPPAQAKAFDSDAGEGIKAAAESDWHDIRAMHAEALAMINAPGDAGAALDAKIAGDFAAARAEYDALKDPQTGLTTEGGRVLNTDLARELSPEYRADRSRSSEVHEPASAFIKRLYREKLTEPTPEGLAREVLFTAGGTGAGKSTGLAAIGGENAGIIYDTNMNSLASAASKIDQALAAGWRVKIVYTFRDPIEALVNGALPRAERMGRTVPLEEHVKTHIGARQVIADLADRYADDPRVMLQIVDNSRGKGNARVVPLETIPEINQVGLHDRAESEVRAAHDRGAIGRQTLRGTLGERAGNLSSAPREGSGGIGPADRGKSEQAGSRGSLDRGAEADPALADRQRREAALGAASPLRARAEQSDTGGLGLFDQANEPMFDLDDGKGPRTAAAIDAEIKQAKAGLEAIRQCLK